MRRKSCAAATHGRLSKQRLDGPSDAFVMRLDPDGLERWTRSFGGDGEDAGLAVATRGVNVFLAGRTQGLHRTVADPPARRPDPRDRPHAHAG